MLLNFLNYAFITVSILYILSVLIYKILIFKNYTNIKTTSFIAFIALMLMFYVLFAILIAILSPYPKDKIIMLLFACCPFVIGRFATYKYENQYSLTQILLIIVSIIYLLKF